MKKVLAISSVLLGVIFLAGCGQQQAIQNKSTTSTPDAQQNKMTQSEQKPLANKPFEKTKEDENNLYFEGIANVNGTYTRSADSSYFCLDTKYEYLFPEVKVNWNDKRKCFNLNTDSLALFAKKTQINPSNKEGDVCQISGSVTLAISNHTTPKYKKGEASADGTLSLGDYNQATISKIISETEEKYIYWKKWKKANENPDCTESNPYE